MEHAILVTTDTLPAYALPVYAVDTSPTHMLNEHGNPIIDVNSRQVIVPLHEISATSQKELLSIFTREITNLAHCNTMAGTIIIIIRGDMVMTSVEGLLYCLNYGAFIRDKEIEDDELCTVTHLMSLGTYPPKYIDLGPVKEESFLNDFYVRKIMTS